LTLVEAGLGALLLAFALAGAAAWCGPVDAVKARSSHSRPTPTSGGLAIIAGACLGAVALGEPGGGGRELAWLLGAAVFVGLLGAADDLLDLNAGVKFSAQLAAAAVIASQVAQVELLPLLPGVGLPVGAVAGFFGSVLFLIVVANAVNFMDGSNGLAPGVGVIALAGLGMAGLKEAPEVAAVALVGAAAGLGFLPWNLRARLFQGDAGAFFTAALIGGVGLLLAQRGAASPYFVVFAVLPLLVDVLLTLLVRARRGVRLTEAHREHLYQLWLHATGKSHLALAWRAWALTAACTATGLWFELFAREWAFAGLMALVALLSAGWAKVRSALVRSAAAQNAA
jgi:UDP-N-acetylmuramyl pentapeptide phosphotransferase/UDP-N-acetylglucosamine-1-phosphate transferase